MQPNWMNWAWASLGVRERAGAAFAPEVAAMFRDVGRSDISDDAVPWCAAFAGACLERAGVPSTRSLLARSYLDWGQKIDGGQLGAVAIFSRGIDPNAGHVGFVVGEVEGDLMILGGNQSNAVTVERFARERLLGFRWAAQAVEASDESDLDGELRFAAGLRHVLEMEGGYTNDPHDPGGPTNKGITLATFARFRAIQLDPATDTGLVEALRQITDEEVRRIYQTNYWRPSRAGDMPPGLDLMHFDASVNHGITGAAVLLQRTLGVDADGEIGPITMAAIHSSKLADLVGRYANARERRYRELAHFWRFGRGWLRRVEVTRARALAAIEQSNGAARREQHEQTPIEQETAMTTTTKSQQSQVPTTPVPSKWWGESITLWGALITTMSTILPIVGPFFGLNLSPAIVEQIGQHVLTILQAFGAIAGITMTVVGRATATTRLVWSRRN